MRVAHHYALVEHPPRSAPSWAPLVERWYQLDPFAYALAEAFTRFGLAERPVSMLLACEGASNATDHAFAVSRGLSPSKFVHTLPNIRASSLLSAMRWAGPVLSLHRDPHTLAYSFREAAERALEGGEHWVWTIGPDLAVGLFRFGAHEGRELVPGPASPWPTDLEILRCFWDSGASLNFDHWVVRKE